MKTRHSSRVAKLAKKGGKSKPKSKPKTKTKTAVQVSTKSKPLTKKRPSQKKPDGGNNEPEKKEYYAVAIAHLLNGHPGPKPRGNGWIGPYDNKEEAREVSFEALAKYLMTQWGEPIPDDLYGEDLFQHACNLAVVKNRYFATTRQVVEFQQASGKVRIMHSARFSRNRF